MMDPFDAWVGWAVLICSGQMYAWFWPYNLYDKNKGLIFDHTVYQLILIGPKRLKHENTFICSR